MPWYMRAKKNAFQLAAHLNPTRWNRKIVVTSHHLQNKCNEKKIYSSYDNDGTRLPFLTPVNVAVDWRSDERPRPYDVPQLQIDFEYRSPSRRVHPISRIDSVDSNTSASNLKWRYKRTNIWIKELFELDPDHMFLSHVWTKCTLHRATNELTNETIN